MSERSVTHATFVIERTYDATPARVFSAFADPVAKAAWFGGPEDWDSSGLELDFRVGGREHESGGPKGGPVSTYEAVYRDIVTDERIVSTYEMYLNDARTSVSVATVELEPVGSGTRLIYTEQGAYFDDPEAAAGREEGTQGLFDQLGAALQREPATS